MNRTPGASILSEEDIHPIAYGMTRSTDLCQRKLQLLGALRLHRASTLNIPDDYPFLTHILGKWIAESCSECPPTVERLVNALKSIKMNAIADLVLNLEGCGEIGTFSYDSINTTVTPAAPPFVTLESTFENSSTENGLTTGNEHANIPIPSQKQESPAADAGELTRKAFTHEDFLQIIKEKLRRFSDDVFGIVKSAHISISTGHGSSVVAQKPLKGNSANITRAEDMQQADICKCKLKSSMVGKYGFNSRCQVDIIDMRFKPDGPFKFILSYQDCLTKFLCLRPLKTKKAEAVAEALVPIFCELGAPWILHCGLGKEYAKQVIKAVSDVWRECILLLGKPRHNQSQGSEEMLNQDIENRLACWIQDNSPRKWSDGLPFIQFQKNICYHSGISRTPYEAMFGCPPQCGLFSLKIPKNILAGIETEEQLEILILSDDADAERGTKSDKENGNTSMLEPDSDSADSPLSMPDTNSCVTCTLHVSAGESYSDCNCPVHSEKQENTLQPSNDSFTSLKRGTCEMFDNTAKRLRKVHVGPTVLQTAIDS